MQNIPPLFSGLSEELSDKIMSFIPANPPEKIVSSEIIKRVQEIQSLALVSKHIQEMLKDKLSDLKKLNHLLKKYHAYNFKYEKNWKQGLVNPHLIDALFTGWVENVHGQHSIAAFTEETENDIKELVRITPQYLESNYGNPRLFD